MTKKLIYDLSIDELTHWVSKQGEPKYRTAQIWEGLYQQYYSDPASYSNLSKTLKKHLDQFFNFSPLIPRATLSSRDGNTEKTLFELNKGAKIETVLMRYASRNSLCVSTQSGCAMGCTFCATGQMGFIRHLTSGEIIAQVIHYTNKLRQSSETLTNVVFMGMGEPFQNYDACLDALRRLNDPDGFNMGSRRFTISTVGIVPKINKFADEGLQVNLAISLHAANNALRSSLIPINRMYPIDKVIEAVKYYIQKTNRRVSFEYALINGVNDSNLEAMELGDLLKG
ncbi:MAG: 23S rRNA (adenine(2503)-C(2))-methyltransferase RlmN, partial [Chloroflexota bacterium]